MIASEVAFKSAPDGLTLLMATADTHSINPNVYKSIRYQASEFVPVSPVAKITFILVGRPGLDAKTTSSLIALAKARGLSFASYGIGSASQVAMEMFMARSQTKLLHVPDQGAAPAFQAVLAGQVDLMMAPVPLASQALDRLTAYGITSNERFAGAAQVPTLAEQGLAVDADSWIGMLAPPKTPRPVVEAVNKAIGDIVRNPEVVAQMTKIGFTNQAGSLEQFTRHYHAELARWGQVIKSAGIQLDQ
jgi:tripartite-type tricarboxylate transporter receptor subunit TctC